MIRKEKKFVEVGEQGSRFLVQKCLFKPKTVFLDPKMRFKKLSLIVTSSWRREPAYDTHPEEVINDAKLILMQFRRS